MRPYPEAPVSGHVPPSNFEVALSQSVTDGLFKAVVETVPYVFLDVVVIASRDPDIQALERGAHGDGMVCPSGVMAMLVHVVERGLEHQFLRSTLVYVQCGSIVEACPAGQILFE